MKTKIKKIFEEEGLFEHYDFIKKSAEKSSEKIENLFRKSEIKFSNKRIKKELSVMQKLVYNYAKGEFFLPHDLLGYLFIIDEKHEAYKILKKLFKEGFSPKYKILDTLEKNHPKYRDHKSLDMAFKETFEIQIRTKKLQEKYLETHENYKDMKRDFLRKLIDEKGEDNLRKIIKEVKQKLEEIEEKIKDMEEHPTLEKLKKIFSEEKVKMKICFPSKELETLFEEHGIKIK